MNVTTEKREYIRNHFPARVKAGLAFKGLSLNKLSKLTKISTTAYYNFFNGEMRPEINTVIRVTEALAVPFEFFSEESFSIGSNEYKWKADESGEVVEFVPDVVVQKYQGYPFYEGSRITDGDLTEASLLQLKADNDSYANLVQTKIADVMNAVDEPTKAQILIYFKDEVLSRVNDIQRAYLEYKGK